MSKEDVIVEMERITAYLERAETALTPAPLKSDPPKIFVSTRPAVLVNIDGPPVMAPIPGTELSYVLNTNWDLLRGRDDLLPASRAGLAHRTRAGRAVDRGDDHSHELPADPGERSELGRRAEGGAGRPLTPAAAPRVFVSETPAELILLDGEPKLDPIKGTKLSWVTNTQSDLFHSAADQRYYYLVAGRWFRAEKLDGPWRFATTELPEDFKKIPPDHPAADVLALVPGTSQAQEAVIRGHIPQTARVERGKVAAPKVTYKGAPEWKPIAGTPLAYAGNSPYDVLKAGEVYYLCFQAVWFVAKSPRGPLGARRQGAG